MPNFATIGQPDVFAAPVAPQVQLSTGEVIRESIFGAADKKDWKPLTLGTFFSEGWGDPFTNAPEGTNGAPKQNWIGSPAGVFGRFATVDFFYTNHLNNVSGLFLTPNAPFMPVHPFTNGNQLRRLRHDPDSAQRPAGAAAGHGVHRLEQDEPRRRL